MDYSVTHPDYDAYAARWQMAADFREGGIKVLQPENVTSLAFNAHVTDDDDDSDVSTAPELARASSRFEWRTSAWNSYLWKHTSEKPHEFQERAARAAHIPLFGPMCSTFTAGVLRVSPTRRGNTGIVWDEYKSDVDLDGTDFDAFIREALERAIGYGKVHAITDFTRSDEPIKTRQDQRSRGLRAYTYLLDPIDLVDWRMDSRGRFLWIKIREKVEPERGPADPYPGTTYQYRIWTRDSWEVHRYFENGGWQMMESGSHGLGEVPISTLWTSRVRRMGVESPMSSLLDIDRRVFN